MSARGSSDAMRIHNTLNTQVTCTSPIKRHVTIYKDESRKQDLEACDYRDIGNILKRNVHELSQRKNVHITP